MGGQAAGAALVQDAEPCGADGLGGRELLLEPALVEGPHPRSGGLVFDRPQAHDHRAHAGDLECAAQAEDAFSGFDLPESRVARRQHRPFRTLQVEPDHFLSGETKPLPFIEPKAGYPIYRLKLERLQNLLPGESEGLDTICNGILGHAPFVLNATTAQVPEPVAP